MNPAGQQNQSDHTANFFWLICLFFGAIVIFWWVDEKYVVIPVFWLRIHEIDFVRFLAELWQPIAHLLHLPKPNFQELNSFQAYMQNTDPSKVDWNKFAAINADIGHWTRYPIIVIFLVLAGLCYAQGASQFHHSYTMKTLRVVGQEVWPQITPIISMDLVKQDIDKGPWAMAKLPLYFCRENDLLSVKTVAGKKVWVLKHKPTFRLFALQLGPLWKGIDALPIHIKALSLVFLARATGRRPVANAILSQIAVSAASGKLDFTGVSEKLAEYKNHKILKWLEKRHAFMTTLMASMLEIARTDGVLASAEFLWLKPVDRRLWFTLNSVGRQTAFVEVAGIYAHWKAEKKVGRALKTPMIKSAVDALEESLQTILFVEESEQWRTNNAG
ncbi:MAG: phosphoesterase [Gammaproteobacteria bacterium CG_4_10_14_0_8_um_filter_38_16]|nr:MAG: phosphoesterase [Gammaproteobacteria bacterium CG_4_10_14_0_8_um_filter_38_16]PJA04405.1 MAG: phosphoesterase [Gammaproteobacteria bacterium CG_4_10_14_0_2_um_filter_38_22]PJB10174.1 MAG: phosphoesterase [Gammaproteobacteria bacterium CG_4_9_14_3_um_filter_38_9]